MKTIKVPHLRKGGPWLKTKKQIADFSEAKVSSRVTQKRKIRKGGMRKFHNEQYKTSSEVWGK